MKPFSVLRGPARLSGRSPGGEAFSSARWVLGAPKLGQPSNEKQRSEQTAEIESIVRELAVEMKLRADRLVGELEVSQDPDLRSGISLIGQDFSPGELAEQVSLVAKAMAEVAGSILSGPLSSYASDDTNNSLDETRSMLEALEIQAKHYSEPLVHGHEGLAEEHLLSYVEDLKSLRDSAERLMVSTEKAPQVLEPGEKELVDATGILVALGALSVGAIMVYLVASD
jgi:hypothetical protein